MQITVELDLRHSHSVQDLRNLADALDGFFDRSGSAGAGPAKPFPTLPATPPVTAAEGDEAEAPDPTAPSADSQGVVWDPARHSASKKRNSDGTWRAKRGSTPAVPQGAAGSPGTLVTPPAVPPSPPTAPATPSGVPAAPPAPSGVPAAPPAPVSPSGAMLDFPGLMKKATSLMAAGKLTRDELTAATNAVGLPNVVALMHKPEFIDSVDMQIEAIAASKG